MNSIVEDFARLESPAPALIKRMVDLGIRRPGRSSGHYDHLKKAISHGTRCCISAFERQFKGIVFIATLSIRIGNSWKRSIQGSSMKCRMYWTFLCSRAPKAHLLLSSRARGQYRTICCDKTLSKCGDRRVADSVQAPREVQCPEQRSDQCGRQ